MNKRSRKIIAKLLIAFILITMCFNMPMMKQNVFAETLAPNSDVYIDKAAITANMTTFNSTYNLDGGRAVKVKFGKRNEESNWYIAGTEKYNSTDTLVLYYAGDNSGAYVSLPFGTTDQLNGDGSPNYSLSTLWKRLNSDSADFSDTFGKKYLLSDEQINRIVPVNLKYYTGSQHDIFDNYLYVPRYSYSAAVVGSSDQFRIGKTYVSTTGAWTRDAANYNRQQKVYRLYTASDKIDYGEETITSSFLVIPAFNLNLSDFLFAYGGETVPEDNPSVVTPGTMNLYFDGSSIIKSGLTVSKDKIVVDLQDTPSTISLMLVGRNGANNYQYFVNLTSSIEINTSQVANIDDFTNCKVWLSCKDSDNTYYAKYASPASPVRTAPEAYLSGDGTVINGVDNTMEYSIDNGNSWISVADGKTTITPNIDGKVLVRYKATNEAVASNSKELNVKKPKENKPDNGNNEPSNTNPGQTTNDSPTPDADNNTDSKPLNNLNKPIPATSPFNDVKKKDAYYYTPVLWAVANGVTTGLNATTFGPDKSCTRGQVVTFLWRAYGEPEPSSMVSPFNDVQDQSKFYYKAVLWAVEKNITTGLNATTFGPDKTVTRDQFVTFLYRAAGKPSYSGTNPFVDISAGQFYTDAVLWAYENNVTTGLNATHFGPKKPCTRGQVVTFIYRALAGK